MWWTTAPLPTGAGRGRGAVVVFQDATAQREREGRRDERYALSETMREQAEYDLAETTWLGELTLAMTTTLDADEALHRLVRQLVPRLADTAVVSLADGPTHRLAAAAHHTPGVLPRALPRRRAGAGAPRPPRGRHPHPGGGGTQHLTDLAPAPGSEATCSRAWSRRGACSCAAAARQDLRRADPGRASASPPFNEADRVLADEVARRISLGLDNARLHAAQADIAAALQRALLTDLPDVAGIELAAHYEPAQHTAEVGGTGTTPSSSTTVTSLWSSVMSPATTSRPPHA